VSFKRLKNLFYCAAGFMLKRVYLIFGLVLMVAKKDSKFYNPNGFYN